MEDVRSYLESHDVAGLLDGLVKEMCKEQPANPKTWMADRLQGGGAKKSLSTGFRSHSCGELRMANVNETVTLSGWVQKSRVQKQQCFVDIRDRFGITQIVFSGDLFEQAKTLGREWVVQITGKVVERSSKTAGKETGDVEIVPTKMVVLGESKTPPFKIEDETDAGEMARMQYRYLDIRRAPVRNALILRNQVTIAVRKALGALAFNEIETPILIKSTPEGARDFIVPSRESQGKWYALPQSPQTFKQLLMVAGMDRYFQIARCFRDEGTVITQNRQPEFTQIDCEMSFVTQDDVLNMFEEVMTNLIRDVTGFECTKFPQLRFDDVMRDYGIDKPDLRFDMKLCDLTTEVKPCETFPKFAQAEKIVAICLPTTDTKDYFNMSKKDLTKFIDAKALENVGELDKLAVKRGTVSGIFWVKVESVKNKKFESPLSKNFSDEQFAAWAKKCGAVDKSLMVLLAGPNAHGETQMCMGKLRHHFGTELGYRSSGFSALWVIDFPLLEWDEDEQRCIAMHHPFTSPHADSHDLFMECDPKGDVSCMEDIRANAYDMVLNGIEAGGGSIRITDPATQNRMFELLGMAPEEYEERFGFLMEAFRHGAPPHGGLAFGLDRLCTIIGEAVGIPQQLDRPTISIRDYMAFPKTSGGADAMIKTPSVLDAAQLAELSVVSTAKVEEEVATGGNATSVSVSVDEGRMAEFKAELDKLEPQEPPNPRGKPTPEWIDLSQKHNKAREALQATMSEAEIAVALERKWYVKDFKAKAGGKADKKDKKQAKKEASMEASKEASKEAPKEAPAKKEKKKKEAPKKEEKKADPEAEKKAAAKKLKAAIKEGGKKGVEIEGAADMGGLSFFCTTLMEADGDMDALIQSFEAMNAEPPTDPEEERRGGAGGVGKMVFSAGATHLQIVCNMPKVLQEDFVRPDGEPVREAMSAVDWVNGVLAKMSKEAPGVKAEGNADFAQASIKGDKEKGIFALKIKDDAMAYAYAILQEKNCMTLGGDSSEGACHGDFECDDY